MIKKLNFSCPVNNRSYGIAGGNLLRELGNVGVHVTWFPIPYPIRPNTIDVSFDPTLAQIIQVYVENYDNYSSDNTSLRLWHQFDLFPRFGKKHIGFTIFELDQFNKSEIDNLNSCDELIVCSEWAKSIVKQYTNLTDDLIHVVPLGINPHIFYPEVINEPQPYRFLNIGKIELRKGHDILSDIFNSAFESTDNVELWISWTNPFLSPEEVKEWESLYKNSKLANKIKFVPWVKTQEQMRTVINNTNCGIFPSRAEGFNLPVLEMMACNKPVIVTNYSGHTQFCNRENSFLIEPNEIEQAHDGKWFFGQGNWIEFAEKQQEQAVEYMKKCYNEHIMYNEEGLKTANNLSWTHTAKLIKDLL